MSLICRNQYFRNIEYEKLENDPFPEADSSCHNNSAGLFGSNKIFKIFGPVITYFHLLLYGDFSGYFVRKTLNDLIKKLDKPDLIISFFTPRGPIYLANKVSDHFDCPFILDFQDNFDIGLREDQRIISKYWMRKNVRNASYCVHVSPEWAQRDRKWLNKKFKVLRHAVPRKQVNIISESIDSFTIFYAGSLNIQKQSPDLFIKGLLGAINKKPEIEFQYAGDNTLGEYFQNILPEANYKYLGWLDKSSYEKALRSAGCLLMIGWSKEERMVVPSKLYEYMSFHKPILIAGKDTGSLNILLKEWEHPSVIMDSIESVESAILEGSKNNFKQFLMPAKCKNVLYEDQLVDEYEKLILDGINQAG